MKLSDIKPRMRVVYIPGVANGNRNSVHVEHGTVSSVNHLYAFVKFDREDGKLSVNSKSCRPEDLEPL